MSSQILNEARSKLQFLTKEEAVYKERIRSMVKGSQINVDFNKLQQFSREIDQLAGESRLYQNKMSNLMSRLDSDEDSGDYNEAARLKSRFVEREKAFRTLKAFSQKTKSEFQETEIRLTKLAGRLNPPKAKPSNISTKTSASSAFGEPTGLADLISTFRKRMNKLSADNDNRLDLQRKIYKEEFSGGQEATVDKHGFDALDNLQFLMHLCDTGRDYLLTFEQAKLVNNLRTLAEEYPKYYKLGDRYTPGSPEYTAKLKEFMELIEAKKPGLFASDSEWSEYDRQVEKQQVLYNAILEQAICEIQGANRKDIDAISDADWYKFNDQVNEIARKIPEDISQTVHYGRNEFNRAPATLEDMINNPDGWNRQMMLGSGYHMNGDDGAYTIKFYHDSGSEAIYDTRTGELITIENGHDNMGTYNFGSQSSPISSIGNGDHKRLDMDTHEKWGAAPNYPAEITSSQAVARASEVQFSKEYEDARKQYDAWKDAFNEAKESGRPKREPERYQGSPA